MICRQEAPRDRTSQQQAQLVMSDELIIFGTPFPSVENDNKNFIPVWKQKVRMNLFILF